MSSPITIISMAGSVSQTCTSVTGLPQPEDRSDIIPDTALIYTYVTMSLNAEEAGKLLSLQYFNALWQSVCGVSEDDCRL